MTDSARQTLDVMPEAHEWAMIVAGMGVVGFAARRRQAMMIDPAKLA